MQVHWIKIVRDDATGCAVERRYYKIIGARDGVYGALWSGEIIVVRGDDTSVVKWVCRR
jgi:hypothetical protein